MITEHSRFQLEATKLGRDVMFQVTVFEREERRRKRLFAETQCSDPFHLVIQFIIREAPDFDALLKRFVQQLEHRGFAPTRMRMRLPGPAAKPVEGEEPVDRANVGITSTGKWDQWLPVPYVSGKGEPPAPEPPPEEQKPLKRKAL